MAEINLDNLLNGNQGTFWNYLNQQKDGYSDHVTGTLVKVSVAQDHEFGKPEQKKYWPDGNPVIMLRMHIRDSGGNDFLFDIKPKSTMWFEDIQPACPGGSLSNVIGKMIKIGYLGKVPVPGRGVMRNKFQMSIVGEGQYPSEGFDNTMPPTLAQAQGVNVPMAPSPQQYVAQQMVQPQQQAQQMYAQQQMDPRIQNAMRSAQQAGAVNQQQVIEQQFPGAQVTQGYPGPMSAMPTAQNPQPQPMTEQVPTDLYDTDIPF